MLCVHCWSIVNCESQFKTSELRRLTILRVLQQCRTEKEGGTSPLACTADEADPSRCAVGNTVTPWLFAPGSINCQEVAAFPNAKWLSTGGHNGGCACSVLSAHAACSCWVSWKRRARVWSREGGGHKSGTITPAATPHFTGLFQDKVHPSDGSQRRIVSASADWLRSSNLWKHSKADSIRVVWRCMQLH